MKTAVIENKFDVYDDAIKLTMSDGRELIATPGHRFLSKDSHLCKQVWKQVNELRI
jgi:intein/homing endonuclease